MNGVHHLDRTELEDLARRALAEDLGEQGDITSKRIVRIDQPGRAQIVAKSQGVLAGAPVAETVFKLIDRNLEIDWLLQEGAPLSPGSVVAQIAGRARAILAAERVALNFLQHLSGVATITAAFVEVCSGYGVRVLCTRKTLPGLRAVQRYAVAVGGGGLHRAGLYDAILIKTSHARLSAGVSEALRRTKANPNLVAEVEVTNLSELEEAMEAGADKILLDNADAPTIAKAVERTRGKIFLEVSGGITLDNVKKVARLKPDAVSVGQITHSSPAVDLSLQVLGPPGAAPR
ncbi:MAG: carboxylating nicotinate-nucleotide diphosphorylase [Actinomycetota bacterium]